jgi:hypothetical protein
MASERQWQYPLLCFDCEQVLNDGGEDWWVTKLATFEQTFPLCCRESSCRFGEQNQYLFRAGSSERNGQGTCSLWDGNVLQGGRSWLAGYE